jgi:RNA polymerase sigma factor (sigma-70 family)
MARQSVAAVLGSFRGLFRLWPDGRDTSDAHLLERFVGQQDREAFAELVRRHGPLVLRVCRRTLAQEADVEDAFQATFLVLARKARTIRKQQSLASWLFAVAQRVAWSARAAAGRRHLQEQQVADMRWVEEELAGSAGPAENDPARLAQRRELQALLEAEVGRLPDKYRAPVILCDLLGRTHAEAAQELGQPRGSISRHLERGRSLLRQRLAGRGLTLGATALAALLADRAVAAVPAAWVKTAAAAAALWASGGGVPAGILSSQAIAISQGVLKAMWIKNLKVALLSILAVCLLGGGAGVVAWSATAQGPANDAAPPAASKDKPGDPAKRPAAAPFRVRFSYTEKAKDPKEMIGFVSIRPQAIFFSADGGKLYVQRGGVGFGGVGFGGVGAPGMPAIPRGGGGGGIGAPGMPGFGNFAQDSLLVFSVQAKKKLKEYPGCQVSALSPDGQALALAGFAQNKPYLRLVNEKTGAVTQSADLNKVLGPALGGMPFGPVLFMGSLAFTPDGKALLVQPGLSPFFWDFKTNKVNRAARDAPGHRLLGFLPNGKSLAWIGEAVGFGVGGPAVRPKQDDGSLCIWDLAKGAVRRRFGDRSIAGGSLAPDGKLVATFSYQFGVGFFAAGAGGIGFGGGGGGGIGFGGGQAPGDPKTAQIKVWDVKTGKLLTTCDTKIAPVPFEKVFVAGNGAGGGISVAGGVQDVAFSPDGRTLASCVASKDTGYIHLWDTRSGRQIAHLQVQFCPQAVAFSRDGNLLAAAGDVGPLEVRVWEVPGLGASAKALPLEPGQLGDLWRDLGADELGKALQAERTLASAPAKVVLPLLKEHLKPAGTTEESRRIAQWISDLDSAQFKVREQAAAGLARGGMAAAAGLKQALQDKRTVEFQRRAEKLLHQLEDTQLTEEQRRQQRALAVLETLDTAEARQLLDQLAQGAPEAWLTQQTRAIQQRHSGK